MFFARIYFQYVPWPSTHMVAIALARHVYASCVSFRLIEAAQHDKRCAVVTFRLSNDAQTMLSQKRYAGLLELVHLLRQRQF